MLLWTWLACSGGPEGLFDKGLMLRSTVDEVMAPAHQELATSVSALDQALVALCAQRDAASLEAAQTSWLAAKVPLKNIEAWGFGPYRLVNIDVPHNVDKWPARADAIEAAIEAAPQSIDVAYIASLDPLTRVKGVPAVGYLLWSEVPLDDRRCEYLLAVSQEMRPYVDAYVESWGAGGYGEQLATAGQGSSAYPTDQDAVTALVSGMLTALGEIVSMKLGGPLGLGTGGTPGESESPHAGSSLQDVLSALDGVEGVYAGAETSLQDYVRSREAEGRVDAAVIAALQDARAAVSAVPSPLEDAVLSSPEAVQAAVDAVDAVSVVINGDMSTLLGVNPTAVEGDND
jgi:predicted lipoprotein